MQEKTQELISERTHIESELRAMKKQAGRLRRKFVIYGSATYRRYVARRSDPERAIVRSSNGTVFQVSLNQRIEPELLKPDEGCLEPRFAFFGRSSHDAWDPIVSGSEMVEKPDITYEMVAGLDDEILSVREA